MCLPVRLFVTFHYQMKHNRCMSQIKPKPSDKLSAFEKYQELSARQVAKFIGVETTKSVWVYVKQGKLPQPRYLAPHKPVWRLGEVLDHTHALMQAPSKAVQGFKGKELEIPAQTSKSKVRLLKERLGLK